MCLKNISLSVAVSAFFLCLLFFTSCKKEDDIIDKPHVTNEVNVPDGIFVEVDKSVRYQTIDGFGGGLVYYDGWLVDHPRKLEIYALLFGGLKIDILRTMVGYGSSFANLVEFKRSAKQFLGHDIDILASSWSPIDSLKSTGNRNGGKGTLRFKIVNGRPVYDYAGFAKWWIDRLRLLKQTGVYPNYISIQNEPNMDVTYESCLFAPTEIYINPESSQNRASYTKALEAVQAAIAAESDLVMPKFIAPEGVGIIESDIKQYCEKINLETIYSIGYHYYRGGDEKKPDTYISGLQALSAYAKSNSNKPIWLTEFAHSEGLITEALHIHNNLVVGNAQAYIFWGLTWPGTHGIIDIGEKYPTSTSGYTITPKYYAMKHFSNFVRKGYQRIKTDIGSLPPDSVRVSAFLNSNETKLAIVIINSALTNDTTYSISAPDFSPTAIKVYQSSDKGMFNEIKKSKLSGGVILPRKSVTTIELSK